ncbi:MAG: PDZ domain-containing protein, partial [Pseudoxanthomonas sp.]
LLPDQGGTMDFDLKWDFAELAPGALAVTTAQVGNYHAEVDTETVRSLYFLAGAIQHQDSPATPFKIYWIGHPPFDVPQMEQWTNKTFNQLQQRFNDPSAGGYTLLMRPFALPRDGGGASRGGFMLEFGTGHMSDAARRIMFTHEMVHHFLGGLDGDSGKNAWYGEGLAEFYKLWVTSKAASIEVRDLERELNVMTEAYYESPFRNLSMEEAGRQRWANQQIQTIPYNRGFMYFVDLNDKIVKHSDGKRSLDDLVLAMLQRRRQGQSYDEAAWRDLLRNELGESAIMDLNRMLSGETLVPAEDAFGPCFERTSTTVPRRDLGFDEFSLLVRPRVITSLVPGSAAARAGLEEGDVVTSFSGVHERIAHSAPNVTLEPSVRLQVLRDGHPLQIAYSTLGEPVQRYRWNLIQSHGAACHFPGQTAN